jgi:TonB-linked SusC/RagA family outer membrane protein
MKKYQTLSGLIFTIMRFTAFQISLMIVLSGVASAAPAADAYGQTVLDEVISISAEGKKIKQVLSEIEKSVKIKFTYNPQSIAIDQKISVDYQHQKLSNILQGIFQPMNVEYQLSGEYIILKKQSATSEAESEKSSPSSYVAGTMSGIVTDEEGLTLPGVNVTVKGTLLGTVTDSNGKYSIPGVDKGSVLVFSFIGYKTEEVLVGDQTSVDLKMVTDLQALGEVVVVGYGTQKEYTSAGAISSVNVSKQLQYGTNRSLSNNLAGQVAGIIGVQRSGEPGFDDANFWIRGISTFAGARQPLVLVDGVERSLNNIDPAEIETFSVLKDASASAVYGVRGANGVVLINTKRGTVGKPSIVLRYEQGVTSPVKLPKFIGAADYMELTNGIAVDAGLSPTYSAERISNTRNKVDPDLYPDVNWLDAITKDQGSNSRLNLTASGGSNFLRYAITGSYYAEKGILERDPKQAWDSSIKLKRYNIRSNVDLDLTPTTLLRVNIGGFLQETNRPPNQSIDDLFGAAFETPPHVHPTQYSSGEIPRVNSDRVNPWALATQRGYERGVASKIESLFTLQQKLDAVVPGLSGRLTFSFDRYSPGRVFRIKDPDYYKPATGRDEDGKLILGLDRPGQVFLGYDVDKQYGDKSTYVEGSLIYSHNIGNHYLDGLLLYNQRSYDNGGKLPSRFQGMAARVSYSFMRRYIAELNFGYNGSENFSKGHRYGFFPSAAVGWLVSEEEFMSPLKDVLTRLKLRASLGEVGNDRLTRRNGDAVQYAYISTISDTDGYSWGVNNDFSRAGRREGFYGVPGLTWETVTKTNLGAELGLWNSTLLQVDFFKEKRRDIFLERQTIPGSSGFTENPFANYGKVENRGVDLSLSGNKQLGTDIFVSVQGTFTYAKNKIIEQDEAPAIVGTYRSTTGKSVNQNFGYIAERLYTNADFADLENHILVGELPRAELGTVRPGDIKYKDLNNDGAINNADQTALKGTVDPQIVYGFGVNVKYKNIDAGFFCQGNGRTYRVLGGGFFMPGSGGGAAGNIYSTVLTDRWTIENPRQDAFWPRLSSSNGNNSMASTWWLKDMSMLRVKHIEVGYSLPKYITGKAHFKTARIFISGNNLLTFSKFDLWDPEINTGNGFKYPIMKSYSAGVNLEF